MADSKISALTAVSSPSSTDPLAIVNAGVTKKIIVSDLVALANLSGLASGVATLLGSYTSANLRAAITDETGTGSAVFANNPSLVGFTLTGTVAGGGNQLNNVIIGTTTPLAGTFTTLTGGTSKWTVDTNGLPTKSNNLTLAGFGYPSILGMTSQKAETGSADANVLTVTPPAAVGSYRVCVAISVASATSGVISWTLSWTDSSGNAQSNIAQQLFQMGTAAPNTTYTVSAAGNYYGTANIDINNGAANIVVKWVGGGTSSAKMSAWVERIN